MAGKTPRVLKVLQGTIKPGRDRAELELETIGVAGLAPVPEWMPEPGQREYLRVAAILAGAGLLTAADESLLVAYAATWAQLVRQWSNGVAPKAADLTAFRLLGNDLGLSPRSRASLPPGRPAEKGNKFASNGKRQAG